MERTGKDKFPFSKIDQVGIVVRDMDKAIKHYESLGIGPFEPLPHYQVIERTIRGKPVSGVKNRIMMAMAGGIQLELAQPLEGASIGREFLDTKGEGVNHFGFYVDDIEKETARLVGMGLKIVARMKFLNGGGTVHFETDATGGVLFELIELPTK